MQRKLSVYSHLLNIMQDKFKAKKIANTSTFLESVTKVKYLETTLISLQSFMKKLGEH